MTSSDSSDSMGSWIPPTPVNGTMSGFGDLYDGEEEIGQTEAVMVSVRYVMWFYPKRSKLMVQGETGESSRDAEGWGMYLDYIAL
jgi:hypothetical protein